VAAFVTTGENVDRMMSSLRRDLDGGEQVVVQSNRGLRNAAMDVFDRTFTITAALQLLAAIVAFIGVFNALMALQLERSREIGTLRATGMSRRQLTRTILTETGMMGVLSGLLALPVGFVMALILIFVINLRSFGWTLTLHVAAMDLVQAFLVAVAAAMLAGIYPALRFGRVSPAEALRAE
jgi:putative ABC transport system permease protein